MQTYDAIVVGGGMAGVSIAAELSADHRVLILDMESALAFHSTGRSAAMFLESYGGPTIRALTTASRALLSASPDLLRPLAKLQIARSGRGALARRLYEEVLPLVPSVELLSPAEAVAIQPLLRVETIDAAVLEPEAMEMDVHALHQLFVRALRVRRGSIVTSARVTGLTRVGGIWTVRAGTEDYQAPIVVDAAGAWADDVARLAGAEPIGLRVLRRSVFMADAPQGVHAPSISDIDSSFYIKPDAGALLCSPADETPQDPADARPDTTEIARAIDTINEVTQLKIRHVRSSWAGLRNFVADRAPVVGYDEAEPGFFWFAAQGGYGIQTAPALARTGAALVRGEPVPTDVAARGLTACALSPNREAILTSR